MKLVELTPTRKVFESQVGASVHIHGENDEWYGRATMGEWDSEIFGPLPSEWEAVYVGLMKAVAMLEGLKGDLFSTMESLPTNKEAHDAH